MLKHAIITHRGCSHLNGNKYEALFDTPPTRKDLVDAQMSLGFHPAGYSGPDEIVIDQQDDGCFLARWTSSGTCD